MKITEHVQGRGHPNMTARHPTTLAVTKDPEISPTGDCFIMVYADKSPSTLSEEFKKAARNPVKIRVRLIVQDLEEEFECYGDPALTFEDDREMVFRKSNYFCGRTVGVRSSKSARDISRRIVEKLRSGNEAIMELTVET
ncbi:MAG: DUF371 domain-containing protein [Thermoproteota archaeon]